MKRKKKNTNGEFVTKEIKRSKYTNDDYQMVKSFIIVLLIVIVCIGLLFILNGKFVTKDQFQNSTTTTTTTAKYDDSVILADHIMSIDKDKYYVLLYEFSDKNQKMVYNSLASSYSNKDVPLYKVNLELAFNSKYYNKEKNEILTPKKGEEFNFTKPTLLLINKKKVIESITDSEKIVEKLKAKQNSSK